MVASSNSLPLQARLSFKKVIIPTVSGCIMIGASLLPWLNGPLGESYSAWQLPIDIGWQFRIAIINYGLLCLCCAIYAFVVAYAHWKPFRGSVYFQQRHSTASLLCLVPIALFLLQYLCIDVAGIAHLAQQKMQMLLIQRHLGYTVAAPRIPLNPFRVDASTFVGRLELLVNQVSIGLLLPCLSAWMLIDKRIFPTRTQAVTGAEPITKKGYILVWFSAILLLVFVFGRAPAAMVCEYSARASLAAGNYTLALRWLDTALVLNPALDQVAYYHLERGQASYFLHPDQQSADSRAYLASAYRSQGDYLDAYSQLLVVWQAHRTTPWVVDEMSVTLESLAESIQPLNEHSISRPYNDDTTLSWLQLLTHMDPSNVYGQYLLGRIAYDLHNYGICMAQMGMVIQLSQNADVQSSAYTYMALSDADLGNDTDARKLLFKALELDPGYHNDTAREELSGLR